MYDGLPVIGMTNSHLPYPSNDEITARGGQTSYTYSVSKKKQEVIHPLMIEQLYIHAIITPLSQGSYNLVPCQIHTCYMTATIWKQDC